MNKKKDIGIIYVKDQDKETIYMVTTDPKLFASAIDSLIYDGICKFYDYSNEEGQEKFRHVAAGKSIEDIIICNGIELKGIRLEVWEDGYFKGTFRP